MTKLEIFLSKWAGRVLMLLGGSFTTIAVLFDRIARDMPYNPGWLQVAGIIAGIGLVCFGIAVDVLMATLRDEIEKLLKA